ncbi:organic cation transporter protein-like [Galleria mellonella]|uniref:Organic cation transporter protein-like n=1 Tax=Galleria mellonella TaxID=7137 RepID=A0ABM3MIB7_GALME|nr:organic cation transporter protein-like [Galleria mellonella]XP_052750910.1 organic cation transporter protein-like [Galleria mellonella]
MDNSNDNVKVYTVNNRFNVTKHESNADEPEKTVDEGDKLAKAIGSFGLWQILIFLLATVPSKISGIWAQLSIIYLAPKTTFVCVERGNTTEGILNSTCYDDCVKYEYFSIFESSIISEWGLICERAWLANFTQTMYMFGVLVGSVMFGFIADRYGRRPGITTAALLQLCCSAAVPFCPNYWTFTAIRFILGTATAGLLVISFVLVVEIVGPSKRELVASVYHIPLSIGEMLMPVFAYYLRRWNTYSIGLAIPNCIFLTYIFLMPESPKWLISVGRYDEASETMIKAAARNKLPTEGMRDVVDSIDYECNVDRARREEEKASYWDLISVASLRMKNIYSCVSWFILGVSFYGGNQYVGQTSSDPFLSVGLAAGFQIPGIIISGYSYKRFGRRSTSIVFFCVCALSNAVLALPESWHYVKLVCGAIAVACAAGAFSTMYIFTSELFPTVARNMAMGASSTCSRLGSMIAPFIAGYRGAVWLPPTVFSLAPLLAVVACICLPETKGRKMADHIDQC